MHVLLALNSSVLIQLFQLTVSYKQYKGFKPSSQGRKVIWVALDPSVVIRGHKGAANSAISIGNSMICSDIWHKYHK